jgi:outer membrane murein-binding lipoprotein Lpp
MKHLRFPQFIAMCVVAAGAFAVSSGCASSPDAKETVSSMGAFGLEVAKVKDSIDGSLMALEKVVASQPAEINANVTAYSKAVDTLNGQAQVVKKRATEMKEKGDEFFKEWEPPENVSKERKAELTTSFAKIKTDMTAAKDEFVPFLASLKDIQGYLKVDPSTKGITSMSELVKKAKDTGAQVKTRIDAVLNQVNSVRGMMSTKEK